MTLSDIRDRIFRDVGEVERVDNERVDATQMNNAINDVYRDMAMRGKCFLGSYYVALRNGLAGYARPEHMTSDMVNVYLSLGGVTSPQPLIKDSRRHITAEHPTYRSTAAGTPVRWFAVDGRSFQVWPPPDTTLYDALVLYGYLVPSLAQRTELRAITSSTNATPIAVTTTGDHGLATGAQVEISGHLVNTAANGRWYITVTGVNTFTLDGSAGNGIGVATGVFTYSTHSITSSTNASPIAITTTVPHNLNTGDSVTISSHLVNTAANGTWRITRTGNADSSRTFTLDGSTGNGVGVATGTVRLLGVPTLAQEWDIPAVDEEFHQMLIHGSVYWLLTRFLHTDNPTALARAQAARADYEAWLPKLIAFYAGGPR